MTEQAFKEQLDSKITAFDQCMITKDELYAFIISILGQLLKNKGHLELFIKRVSDMRDLQKEFFRGNNKVIGKAKSAEQMVDRAINKLLTELGYTIENKEPEQGKML